jgi:hypothetical protein
MQLHPLAVIFSISFRSPSSVCWASSSPPPLVAIIGIVHEDLYRKRFLPAVTDEDLDRLARSTLLEEGSGKS